MSQTPGKFEAARDAIVMAALAHVPFDGWSRRTLEAGAKDAGLDATMAERAFARGPSEAVTHFSALADRKLTEQAQTKVDELATMRFTERVRWLVRTRIEAWTPHREAVRRTVAFLALPGHAAQAARAAWQTADTVWHAAGDKSTDFSYYTKRAILVGVYSSTLLCWLDDASEDSKNTWAFLDRRLADVGRITKLRRTAESRLEKFPNPLRAARAARDGSKRRSMRAR